MIRIKKSLWRSFGMSTVMTGALAFAVPALASPANAEHANMKKGANEGVTSAGKLSASDAHALWLLHKISKGEIAQAELAQTKAKNDKVKDLAGDLRDDHQKMDEDVLKLAQENNVQFAGEAVGTGGSGMEGTRTGMTPDTGSTATPESKTDDQGASTAAPSGGTSTVEEIPNSGTGGSGMSGSSKTAGAGSMHAGMGQAASLSSADRSLITSGAAQLEKLQGLEGAQFDRTFVRDQVKDHQKALSMLRGVTAQNDDVKDLLKDSVSTLEKHEKDARDALKELRGVGGSGDEGSGMTQPSDSSQPDQSQPDQTQPAPTP